MREIKDRFTKSELVVVGWRSQEMVYQMSLKIPKPTGPQGDVDKHTQRHESLKNLPDKYFNEEGDLDLRKVSGKEALQYLRNIGW